MGWLLCGLLRSYQSSLMSKMQNKRIVKMLVANCVCFGFHGPQTELLRGCTATGTAWNITTVNYVFFEVVKRRNRDVLLRTTQKFS